MIAKKPSKEENYQYLVRIMQSGNVDTQEKAQGHIDGLVKKSWKFSSIPLLILLIGYSFAPQLLFFWGLFSLFGLAWIWCSTYNTNTMIRRYIQETFIEQEAAASETSKPSKQP